MIEGHSQPAEAQLIASLQMMKSGQQQGNSPPCSGKPLYVADVEEIRVSPVVSRKGYLNCLDDKTNGWTKRWVVSTYHELLKLQALQNK